MQVDQEKRKHEDIRRQAEMSRPSQVVKNAYYGSDEHEAYAQKQKKQLGEEYVEYLNRVCISFVINFRSMFLFSLYWYYISYLAISLFNSLPAGGKIRRLLMTFANNLNLDEAPLSVGPHLRSNLFDNDIVFVSKSLMETMHICIF